MKLLAGVYPPTGGTREVCGQISSLFELSLGFEMDASGWDNMMYRGYLQGETPRSIREKMGSIADFSELGQFLDMPIRYYSSGMLVRLAFSIATAINPEVLLLDEVLAAGDASFQAKAQTRMRGLISSARAVVIVSHDLASVEGLCERVLWLDRGRIRMDGPAREVIAAYRRPAVETRRAEAA